MVLWHKTKGMWVDLRFMTWAHSISPSRLQTDPDRRSAGSRPFSHCRTYLLGQHGQVWSFRFPLCQSRSALSLHCTCVQPTSRIPTMLVLLVPYHAATNVDALASSLFPTFYFILQDCTLKDQPMNRIQFLASKERRQMDSSCFFSAKMEDG